MRRAVTCFGAVVVYIMFRLIEVNVIFKNSDKVHTVRREVRTIVREAALVGLSVLISTVAADMAVDYSRKGFRAVWTHMKGGQSSVAETQGGASSVPINLGNFPVDSV